MGHSPTYPRIDHFRRSLFSVAVSAALFVPRAAELELVREVLNREAVVRRIARRHAHFPHLLLAPARADSLHLQAVGVKASPTAGNNIAISVFDSAITAHRVQLRLRAARAPKAEGAVLVTHQMGLRVLRDHTLRRYGANGHHPFKVEGVVAASVIENRVEIGGLISSGEGGVRLRFALAVNTFAMRAGAH